MPTQTTSQTIGRKGERWLQQALPPTWIFQPPLDDVGVDGVVVICEQGETNGLEFRVQIKSAENWHIRDASVVHSGFSRENLRYLLTGFTPTLLVLYEVSSDRGIGAWINHLVYRDLTILTGTTSTVSLRVPLDRTLCQDTWPHIARELLGLNVLIGKHVSTAGRAFPVLRFLNRMARVLEHLDFAANATKPHGQLNHEDQNVLAQLELSCHRDATLAIRDFEDDLKSSGVTVEGLPEFANEYVSKCSEFIRDFHNVVKNPDLIQQVQIDIEQMRDRRQGFVRSIIASMRQVSELGLGVRNDA